MGEISLSITSCTKTWLNGSDIPHNTMTHIEVLSDEGTVVRVYMSMDQFVRLLIGGSRVPCTLEAYRGKDGEFKKEIVTPPKTVKQRMENRLGEVEGEFHTRLSELSKTLKDIQDGHIKAGKKVVDNIAHEVEILKSHHMSNRNYVLGRAQEELEHLTENAAAQLAGKLGVQGENIALLLGGSGQKALPPVPVPLEPTVLSNDRDERPISEMGPTQLAETIHRLMRKIEMSQPPCKDDGSYDIAGRWYGSGASLAGNNKIMVTYVSYQSHTALDLEEARKYALYLASGGKQRHFEFFRGAKE